MRYSKRLLAAAVSATLLGVLLASIDRARLLDALAGASIWWFALAMLLFVPQIAAIAWRWKRIASPIATISWREAGRQVVASNCLNLVLPSKLGDLAKGVFLHRQGRCRLRDGMHVVVFEKFLDLASLAAWMLVGWMLAPRSELWILALMAGGAALVAGVWALYFTQWGAPTLARFVPAGGRIAELVASAPQVVRLVRADGTRRARIVAWSFAIWLLHLLQIYCFFRCVGAPVSLVNVLALMPIAIFAGLLPLTIAGVGTRDWAIVAVFAGMAAPAVLVAAGLFVSLRYVVPALAGLPFVPRYFLSSKQARAALDRRGSSGIEPARKIRR